MSEVKGMINIGPKEFVSLNVSLYIPSNAQMDKIILQLRLMTDKNQPFGDYLIGIIDLDPSLSVDQSVLFEKNNIDKHGLNILCLDTKQTSGGGELEEGKVYELAIQLSEKGFGTFERCQQMIKACKGNLKEAQKVLSSLMVKEFK